MPAETPFAPPLKRSVTIAGHETSVALEPMFWAALEKLAAAAGQPLNALIARIDAERLDAPSPPNLASALRQWLFRKTLGSADDGSGETFLSVRRDVEP
jgi:predicted DNA-binding ribbon-helix-helix protein